MYSLINFEIFNWEAILLSIRISRLDQKVYYCQVGSIFQPAIPGIIELALGSRAKRTKEL